MEFGRKIAAQVLVLMALVFTYGEASVLNGYGPNIYLWSIIVLILAIVGLLMVIIIEVIIMYKIFKLGGVPWRSIWLGQLLLLGILLSYLTCLVYVFRPSTITCGLVRFFTGFCYSLMLSVLFVKILIVLSPKSQQGFLKFGHQVLILFILISVQIIINTQWVVMFPPETVTFIEETVSDNSNTVIQYEAEKCKPTKFHSLFFDFLTSFIYLMVLRIVTIGLTLKSYQKTKRQDKKANSEAKWILLTLIVTIVVWIIWILVGCFVPDGGMASVSIGLWATATCKLLIIFIPKLHKLANLKKGEYYYEDEVAGMKTYYSNGAIEMDPDPEHHSVIAPPSYRADSIVYGSEDRRIVIDRPGSYTEFLRVPEYQPAGRLPPSVILEERSNMSEIGPSVSVVNGPTHTPLMRRESVENMNVRHDPDSLEMKHPGTRSGIPAERFDTLSMVSDDYGPSSRYYTIGGHGRRGAASVIGAPRYERRYMAPGSSASLSGSPMMGGHYIEVAEPMYAHERPVGPASVIGAPRYEPRRVVRGYTNEGYVTHERPVQYVQVAASHHAASVIGAPRYEPGIRHVSPHHHELHMSQPKRTASYTDLRVNTTPNGNVRYHHDSLPHQQKFVMQQPSNGRLVQIDPRRRTISSDDILERRSVY